MVCIGLILFAVAFIMGMSVAKTKEEQEQDDLAQMEFIRNYIEKKRK